MSPILDRPKSVSLMWPREVMSRLWEGGCCTQGWGAQSAWLLLPTPLLPPQNSVPPPAARPLHAAESTSWSSLVAQWVKDLALSLLWLGSLMWCGFHPWPGNFCTLWEQPKKKKKKKEKKEKEKKALPVHGHTIKRTNGSRSIANLANVSVHQLGASGVAVEHLLCTPLCKTKVPENHSISTSGIKTSLLNPSWGDLQHNFVHVSISLTN